MNIENADAFIADVKKQVAFGTAAALTATAKEAQKAVVGQLFDTFTIRGTWYLQSNEFGIRIKPADKRDDPPVAEVKTAADWLLLHETGGVKQANGGRVAVPQQVVSSRAAKIPASKRPRALSKAFVLPTSSGPALFKRLKSPSEKVKGPDKRLLLLYTLENSVTIRKQPVFFPTVKKVYDERFQENLGKWLDKAFQTAR